jgi:site-specific DNA-methyltransferase (adenine-specific)
MQSHEDIIIFCNGKMPYYPQMEKGEPYKAPRTGGNRTNRITASGKDSEDFKQKDNEGFRYPKSVLKFSIHCGSKLHPTQKPVELMEYLIKTYTKEGDVVLDNTMGSGTTGVACKNTGRKFIGIELDGGFFEIAKNRIC